MAEQLDAKKCETNANSNISASLNSSKINANADLACSKNINPETLDARLQQQKIAQLQNSASILTDVEPEIKPLTDIIVNLEDIKPG